MVKKTIARVEKVVKKRRQLNADVSSDLYEQIQAWTEEADRKPANMAKILLKLGADVYKTQLKREA